jgi:hypothetical protein
VELIKALKITTLIVLTIEISLVKFYNPVFAGPAEDIKYQIEATKNLMSGDLDSAKSFIDKIEDKKLKEVLIVGVATGYIRKEDFNSAEPFIEKIEDKKLKETLATSAMAVCLSKGEMQKASEFLFSYVEEEQVLTNILFVFLTKYKDKSDYLGMIGFVSRFIFSGKIFQVKW